MLGELVLLDLLVSGLLVDDHVVAIDHHLLDAVAEDAFKGLDFVDVAELADGLGDLSVQGVFADQAEGGVQTLARGHDHVGLLAFHLLVLGISSDDDGVGHLRDVPVNVAAQVTKIRRAQYILARSPSASFFDSSLSGEKWPQISFTLMHVGKAIPFSVTLHFLLV